MNGGGQIKQQHHHLALLRRTSSYSNTRTSSNKIAPSASATHHQLIPENQPLSVSDQLIVRRHSPLLSTANNYRLKLSSFLRAAFLHVFSFPIIPNAAACTGLPIAPSPLGRKVTGTLFGNRRGHVSFAVQDDPRSEPVLLLELAMTTAMLVKEMSSGLVRIALECEKLPGRVGRLFNEPVWTMYCNGRKSGYASNRSCTGSDWHVLSTIQSVSVGAGVIPVLDDERKGAAAEGELLYMRARFERVVGNRDSEAFYMMNPDKNGCPELSIFLLRI